MKTIRPLPARADGRIPAHWTEKPCRHCGTEFAGPRALMSSRRYCSSTCYRRDQSRMQREALDIRTLRESGERFKPAPKTLRSRRWELRFPGRRAAQRAVARALESGKLLRACECSHCGQSDGRITHHHWSYRPDHRLEVEALCSRCHVVADGLRARAEHAGYHPYEVLAMRWELQNKFSDAETVEDHG